MEEKMEFEEFVERIALAAGQRTDGRAEIQKILKTNDVKRTGLVITGQDTSISPVVYLEKYYEDFCRGKDFDRIISEIMAAYLDGKKAEADIAGFLDWEKIKGRIAVKLVNYEANRELLKAIPHRKFLDLAEVYYTLMDIGGQGMGSILIYNTHLEMWGIGERKLTETAYANYRKHFPVEIKSMAEIVAELTEIRIPQESEPAMNEMYVATNRWKLFGAAVMLFPEMLKGLADKWECDLYILPSSIHEVILLPASTGGHEGLAEIVEEVNRTQVTPEEKLSDHVYRYRRESGRVEFA